MYDNPFNGQDEYAKGSAIVGMCTDENGYADIDDVMALASSAGLCEDYGLLEFATQESLRKYIREIWTDTPHDKRPRRSELESWTEKIIQGVKIEEQKKQVAAVEEKKRLMKESADFLKFLLTKPRVKNKKSSATGTVSKVSAQKDYKWFNVTVKYSDSTEKNYAPNSKETFYDLFELVADGQE